MLKRVLDSVERLKVLLVGNGLKYPPRKRVFQNNTLYHAIIKDPCRIQKRVLETTVGFYLTPNCVKRLVFPKYEPSVALLRHQLCCYATT